MPIYSYRCESCGVQFDHRQRFSDEPLKVCPECEEPALRKLIQPVGVVFKGSGFYVTDNRGASNGGRTTSTTNSTAKDSAEKSEGKAKEESSED